MQNSSWQMRLGSMGAVALACCLALPVSADWSDNFNGGLQQPWVFGDVETSATFSAGSVNDQLVLTDTAIPDAGGTKTGFGVVFDPYTDLRMTGTINPAGNANINDSVGLVFRVSFLEQQFYMAEINYSSGELIIYRNGGPGDSNLVTEPIPGLDFSESVYVEVEAIGDQLTVWAYEAPGGNLRAMVSIVDASFPSGDTGVLVNENFGGLPTLGVWDDLTVEAIVAGNTGPGDFDGLGTVGNGDLTLLLDGWGVAPGPDWVTSVPVSVGNDSLTELLDNWGNSYVPLSTVSVPEPGSLLLGCLALLTVSAARRR